MPKESPERFIRFEQVVRPEDGKSTDGAIVPSRDNPVIHPGNSSRSPFVPVSMPGLAPSQVLAMKNRPSPIRPIPNTTFTVTGSANNQALRRTPAIGETKLKLVMMLGT